MLKEIGNCFMVVGLSGAPLKILHGYSEKEARDIVKGMNSRYFPESAGCLRSRFKLIQIPFFEKEENKINKPRLNIGNIHTLIKFWRDQRDNSITPEHKGKAACYVDAFQTVLVNHFLEPLPDEPPAEAPQKEKPPFPKASPTHIKLTKAEMQSGCDRQCWAEDLIIQLPRDFSGREEWLLNYGRGEFARGRREAKDIEFNEETQAAETGVQGGN